MKVWDSFSGLSAELGGIRDSCPNIYHFNLIFNLASMSSCLAHGPSRSG